MANKKCLVFETLGKVSDLRLTESQNNEVRLSGVFGVCGIRNQNNRVYDKENYRQMVESLQKTIATEGCPGELEHPNSMNINLENVSHKIESIQMNEDGTITGTILLLNTPKGQIAKAIVEGGLPLYISSRGSGTITNEGRVTLSTIKTYDLVGTPGFSQAKLTLKENQTVESLNESLDEGNISWAIITEGDDDDLLGDSDDEKKDDKKDDEKKEDKKDDESKDDDDKKDSDKKDNKNNKDKTDMNELKEAIDKLSDKVTSLEAELHVAQESLNSQKPVNYEAIETWIKEEFAPEFRNEIEESVTTNMQQWVNDEYSQTVQTWVTEEYSQQVQKWVIEEFAPEVQSWVTEEFAPEVQNWITEEYSPVIENWITEEYSSVVDEWINEEFAPVLENKVNENVSAFMESQKAARLDEIDSVLESLSNDDTTVNDIIKEQKEQSKYAGVYVVENMPAEYAPSWEMLDESRKDEIVRSSRMYDFTKNGVLESFWANVDFNKKDTENVNINENNNDVIGNYHQNILSQMMRLRRHSN